MGKNNILFICGHYAFPTAANSICVQNLAEELVSQGHNVYVLAKGCEYTSTKEEIKGVTVWKYYGDSYSKVVSYFNRHKGRLWHWLFDIIQLIRYSYVTWFYPVTSPQDTPRIFSRAKTIIEKYNIDTLVATFMPYEAIKAAIKLKGEYGDRIKVVTYHLDMLTNPNNDSTIIVKIKKYQVEKALKKEFDIIDRILLPNTAPAISDKKVRYVDFPLYLPDKNFMENGFCVKPNLFDSECINIAIAGSLDGSNRNPLYFCKLIDELPQILGKRVVLHIWGKLSGISLDGYQNVIHHGMAKVEDVHGILNSCDFLLNVGNEVTFRMIPSKIFQMFAAKKPILFCIRSKEDKSLPYFAKYGYVCLLEEYCKNEVEDVAKLQKFLHDYYNKKITVDDKLFEMSTPKFICQKIME